MPRKISELINELKQAGFKRADSHGGSHRKFKHSSGMKITLSGNSGEDAKHYQERDVKRAIEEANR